MATKKNKNAKDPTQKKTEALLARFENNNRLRLPKFRIATWDAGWWQARSALADASLGVTEMAALKQAHEELKAKLLPQLVTLGFIG